MRSVLMVDVDGVLVSGAPRDAAHWSTRLEADLGVSMETLQAELFTPHWEAIVTGRDGLMERLTPVLARHAPSLTAQRFVDYWFAQDARIDPQVLEVVRHHRRSGVRVFLATNQEHLRAKYLMETLGFATEVDGILYSAALGDRKPGAAFFRLAAEAAKAKAADIAFVDDAAPNVEAARKAGWSAVQWTGGGDFRVLIDGALAA